VLSSVASRLIRKEGNYTFVTVNINGYLVSVEWNIFRGCAVSCKEIRGYFLLTIGGDDSRPCSTYFLIEVICQIKSKLPRIEIVVTPSDLNITNKVFN